MLAGRGTHRVRVRVHVVLQEGQRIPEATVWTAPNQPASTRAIVAEGPVLFLFYLFDWSST